MKKLLVVLLVLLTSMIPCVACSAQAEMMPIGQMSSSETWTEIMDTVNGPVQIDVTISLPDVTALPIYEVVYRDFTQDELKRVFPQAEIAIFDHNAMIAQGDFAAKVYPIAPDDCTWDEWPADGDRAENAPDSKQDVENMLQELWPGLYGGRQTSVWTRGMYAHSRTWRKGRLGELVEPVSEHGYYSCHLELAVNDVTVYNDLFFERDRPGDVGPHAEDGMLDYYDADNYQLLLSDLEIIRTIAEDAPLLPVEAIKYALRPLISTGHLREIYRIELCYVPMWSDARDSMITVPAWVVHGEYHDLARAPSYDDTDDYYLRTFGGCPLVIPAQTGKVIDYTDSSRERWLASTYLTEW